MLVRLLLVCSILSGAAAAAEDAPDLSAYYGFLPVEIFKLETRSSNMVAGDLNHDGLTDLALVDNGHSRIDLLQQRKEQPEKLDEVGAAKVNQISSDWRFEHRKIPVDHEIAALTLGDFNGDGRTDLAYFGTPDQLVIRRQPESGDWVEKRQIRLPDVLPLPWLLAAGDLNNDGKDDLVALGRYESYLLYQQADGTLGTPKRLLNTSEKLGLAQIADLDGDGRNDLCYLAGEGQTRSLCARLQLDDGQLGPEYRFELERPRALTLQNVDGRPGQEILALDSRTGRLKMVQLQPPRKDAADVMEHLIQFGFGRQGGGKERDLAVGDLDGDGLSDVVATDPEASRMLVFRQRPGSGLDLGNPFPGLVGVEQVRLADFDGDKRSEVVVQSGSEKTIGLSRYEDGRLTFPQPLPIEGEPAALDVADLDGNGKLEITYISRAKEGRSATYTLHALRRTEDGQWEPHRFGDKTAVPLELKSAPDRLTHFDANGDRRADFLVFQGSGRTPQLFMTNDNGVPREVTAQGSFGLGAVSAAAVSFSELGGKPAVLVAQENFARNMQVDAQGKWRVADQYNTPESGARVAGVTALDLDGKPGNEIVLVDTGVRKLRVLRQEEGVYRPWKEIELGEFAYKGLRIADLNGDDRGDLLLIGADKFAVLYAGGATPELKELASFESRLENVYPSDVSVGDLNGDGRMDAVIIDTREHFVELVDYVAEKGFRHALYFRVFEEKSFTEKEGSGSEPRESLIADVTNDGRPDLVLLAHDRVLVYPQDDGRSADDQQATAGTE